MKNIFLLFLTLSIQFVFSQNNESIGGNQEPIYELTEVEKSPEFNGGLSTFYEYVWKNFTLPLKYKSGKIVTKFVIEIDGTLSNIDVFRDDVGAKREVLKVFEKCPKWIAGEKNGQKVRIRFLIPIKVD